MLKIAWRGVRHNPGRYIATLVAIITGVAFFAATGFLSDRVIDALEGDVNRQFSNIDVAIVVDEDGPGSDFADELRIDGAVADQIAALPEVEAIGGDLSGSVAFLAADGTTFADGATGRLWIDDAELNPVDVVEGVAPAATGEITVDEGIADEQRLGIGDEVTVLTSGGKFPGLIVGITSFGESPAIDRGGTVGIGSVDAFTWLNGGVVEYQDLYLRGSASQADILAAVKDLVPSGFVAQLGDDFLQDKRDEVGTFGRTLKTALQGFAALALFVGGFVIYNTFSVIVAQRLRELAVMAAIGATPKQIKRSLRFEGIVIGVIGSGLGVVAGFGLAYVMIAILSALGVNLPGSGIKIGAGAVFGGIVVGTLITFFSVMIPARRAAKTEPIEALRQAATESSSLSRKRVIASVVLLTLGVLGLLSGSGPGIGFGGFALFIGVIVAGPMIALGGSKVFRPIASLFGLEGRLAADNTSRNPQRTATTSNALLIGVYLVTLVTVAGTSVKDFAVGEINKLAGADFVMLSGGSAIDDELVAQIVALDKVDAVTPFSRLSVTLDGEPSVVSTGDFAAMATASGIEVLEGSFDDLGPNRIAVADSFAVGGSTSTDGPTVGSTVTVVNSAGDSFELEVAAVLEGSIDTTFTGSLVDADTFVALGGTPAPTAAFVDTQPGAQSDAEDEINEILSVRPDVTLASGDSFGQLIGTIFDFVINAVNGLLLMSVVVALIGIVNTMSLSILERRRELGLLRVIGMVDKRVQRMVRIESVLISSLGTISGILVGTFTGWALIRAISNGSDAEISVSLPAVQLLIVLVLGVALGFIAALIPARRSTRLEVLESIQAS